MINLETAMTEAEREELNKKLGVHISVKNQELNAPKEGITISDQTHEPFSRIAGWSNKDALPEDLKLPRVPNWELLLEPVQLKEKTKGGIILSGGARDQIEKFSNIGKVLVKGKAAYTDARFNGEAWCEVGDWVVFPRHSAERFKYKGRKYILIPDDKVRLVIDDPMSMDDDDSEL